MYQYLLLVMKFLIIWTDFRMEAIKVNILRPPGGGSITVFSTVLNKAVLLSHAFTLQPHGTQVPQ